MLTQEEIKTILSFTASFCTILQFLSGALTCIQIAKKKSTGEYSPFPFVSGALSTALWLRYGFLIHEPAMVIVNTIGTTLFSAYVFVFFIHSIKKLLIIKQVLMCLFLLVSSVMYTQQLNNYTEVVDFVGILCCCITIVFFASPLISLAHVIKVQSSESLPFPIILMTFIVSIQWFLYGLILQDSFIQIPNFLGCVLSAFQLALFYIYPKKYKLLDEAI